MPLPYRASAFQTVIVKGSPQDDHSIGASFQVHIIRVTNTIYRTTCTAQQVISILVYVIIIWNKYANVTAYHIHITGSLVMEAEYSHNYITCH